MNEEPQAMREMSLIEFVRTLPLSHRAVKELRCLLVGLMTVLEWIRDHPKAGADHLVTLFDEVLKAPDAQEIHEKCRREDAERKQS